MPHHGAGREARVLRECQDKRTIIAEFLRRDAVGDRAVRSAVEDILKALCAVYSQHPDYDLAWA